MNLNEEQVVIDLLFEGIHDKVFFFLNKKKDLNLGEGVATMPNDA